LICKLSFEVKSSLESPPFRGYRLAVSAASIPFLDFSFCNRISIVFFCSITLQNGGFWISKFNLQCLKDQRSRCFDSVRDVSRGLYTYGKSLQTRHQSHCCRPSQISNCHAYTLKILKK
jgi:hypothetical protein